MKSFKVFVIFSLLYQFGYAQASDPVVKITITDHLKLADNYQKMLFPDSATYHANEAMNLYRALNSKMDSTLISKVYAIYGNAMRNGGSYHDEIKMASVDPEPRCRLLKAFLDTALMYATSDAQRANIEMKIGTMYSDVVPKYKGGKEQRYLELSKLSIKHLKRSLKLDRSPLHSARIYALIGLNYQYTLQHEKAETYYREGLEFVTGPEGVRFQQEFLTLCNWRGSNLEEWYDLRHDIQLLLTADSIYNRAIGTWRATIDATKKSGTNDGYHIAPINKSVPNALRLHKLTNDDSYLHEAFKWADWTKYPTFRAEEVSIGSIQELLDDSTAFILYTYVSRPDRQVAFVICTNTVEVAETHAPNLDSKKLTYLYEYSNMHEFKQWSHRFYNGYFKQVDSLLTARNISKVIVSNSDQCSMLNLDVLISDTNSTKWQELPYLFHKYRFSYALTARSYVESYSKKVANDPKFGVTIGQYESDTDLRFSKKLVGRILDRYDAAENDLRSNLLNHDVSLCLLHGKGSYTINNAEILTTSSDTFRVNEVFGMDLTNALVLLTACNTNSSRQYYSEGAVGNFSKAFRYAGARSTVTTSWQIDERSNAFITERLIHYLAEGLHKNDALWKAKKDYWDQCVEDEEFKPLYWSSYVLTGNISPVIINERGWLSKRWLWLAIPLFLGLAFFGWKRFT